MNEFDYKTLVGLAEEDAARIAKETGFSYRIIKRDAIPYRNTMDYVITRLGFEVMEGVVTRVTKG